MPYASHFTFPLCAGTIQQATTPLTDTNEVPCFVSMLTTTNPLIAEKNAALRDQHATRNEPIDDEQQTHLHSTEEHKDQAPKRSEFLCDTTAARVSGADWPRPTGKQGRWKNDGAALFDQKWERAEGGIDCGRPDQAKPSAACIVSE